MSGYELTTQPQSNTEMTSDVTELQRMDDNNSEEKQFLKALRLLSIKVITKFSVVQGSIYCVDENGQMGFYLVPNKLIDKKPIRKIERFDVNGIPRECFNDALKMHLYLSNANKDLVEYEDRSGYQLKVRLKGLKGGGNMMAPDQGYKWPVMGSGDNAKIVIPYSLESTEENNKIMRFLYIEPETSQQRAALLAEINSRTPSDKLRKEKDALLAITVSIQEWNKTPVVELIPLSVYKERYGVNPTKWIGFKTYNEGFCKAPGLGMPPGFGEYIITCDIERTFHADRVQSIMHEIGHVIGLRHEQARTDRDNFVVSNLSEAQNGIRFGNYDFYSIMHYKFGNYPKGEYLYLKDASARSKECIEKLNREVGIMPRISPGDISTIRKLYEAEFKAAKAKASVKTNVKENADDEFSKRLASLHLSSHKATHSHATATASTAAAASAPASASATSQLYAYPHSWRLYSEPPAPVKQKHTTGNKKKVKQHK